MSNGSNGSDRPALIGHELPAELLARALRTGRIANAYLFYGPRAVGKRTAARLFAAAAQCLARRDLVGTEAHPGLDPCGECESCRRAAAGTHPDIIEVEPDSPGGQNISVRQATAVVGNVALRPKIGPRRFYLIGRAELLNEEAANALLKTLEEPGEFATLILCAPGLELVLPTISSRCHPVRFDPVPAATIAAGLEARFGLPTSEAEQAARAAGGSPGIATAAATDPAYVEWRETTLALFEAALDARARCAADPAAAVVALKLSDALRSAVQSLRSPDTPLPGAAASENRPLKEFLRATLEMGQTYIRDILLLAAGGPKSALLHPDRLTSLEGHRERLSALAAGRLIELLGETSQLLERNVAPQLALDRLFLNFIHDL